MSGSLSSHQELYIFNSNVKCMAVLIPIPAEGLELHLKINQRWHRDNLCLAFWPCGYIIRGMWLQALLLRMPSEATSRMSLFPFQT